MSTVQSLEWVNKPPHMEKRDFASVVKNLEMWIVSWIVQVGPISSQESIEEKGSCVEVREEACAQQKLESCALKMEEGAASPGTQLREARTSIRLRASRRNATLPTP